MPLRAKEVSEQLNVHQWTYVCTVVDSRYGHGTKFDVVSIKREAEKLFVLLCLTGGSLHMVEVAA